MSGSTVWIKYSEIGWIMEKAREFRQASTSVSLTTQKPLTIRITTNCGKILKEIGMPDHLTCLLWNLYASQEATVRTEHGPTDWIKIGKGVCQGYILSPCLYAENIMWNAGLEKAVATHSSTLAWKIPWTEEPGGLQSLGLLGVRHDWATSLSLFTFMHWRRKWQPTPVFLPGESQGRGRPVGCCLRGHTEPDTTEVT